MVKYKVRFVVNWLSIEGVPGRQPGTAIKLKWKKSTFNRGSSNPAPVVQGSARWQDSRSNVTTTLVWPVGGHPYNRNVVRVTVIECHPRVGGGWLGFLFKGGFHHSRKIGIAGQSSSLLLNHSFRCPH